MKAPCLRGLHRSRAARARIRASGASKARTRILTLWRTHRPPKTSFGPAGVEWVSVGDSPLLLFRQGEIALLNEDHSLAPELDRLAALGRMTPEEAKSDPRRHMLRSAVTGDELDLVDVSRRPLALEAGDYVILRATMDCLVAMSACPQDLLPINGAERKIQDAHYQILS